MRGLRELVVGMLDSSKRGRKEKEDDRFRNQSECELVSGHIDRVSKRNASSCTSCRIFITSSLDGPEPSSHAVGSWRERAAVGAGIMASTQTQVSISSILVLRLPFRRACHYPEAFACRRSAWELELYRLWAALDWMIRQIRRA